MCAGTRGRADAGGESALRNLAEPARSKGSAISFEGAGASRAGGEREGSAVSGAEPTSSIEPPAPFSASSRSWAACFITVRSSGGGISISELVFGNIGSAGRGACDLPFDGGGALPAAALMPSPIMVALRMVGPTGATPAGRAGAAPTGAGLGAARGAVAGCTAADVAASSRGASEIGRASCRERV